MSLRFSASIGKKEFINRAKTGLIPPVYCEVPYKSPVEIYPLFSGPMSFILESVKGSQKTARYSFIGFTPYIVYKAKNGLSEITSLDGITKTSVSPLRMLSELIEGCRQFDDNILPPFRGGAVGLLSYDFVHYLEKVPATTKDDLLIPDAHFMMIDRLIAFDHLEKKAWAICAPGAREPAAKDWSEKYDEAESAIEKIFRRVIHHAGTRPPLKILNGVDIRHDTKKEEYIYMVERAKKYISAGDIFQANLSLRVSSPIGETRPWDLYLILREINPSPFSGFIDFGDYFIISSSPERLVRVNSGVVETRPIAGTRPRGASEKEDALMRRELLLNEKERAEHIMLIDLERNDLGRICDYGSVYVDEMMTTEDYSHVIHIVSNIKGRIAAGKKSTDIIKAAFPGGTITGVPKVRCMEIIDELESFRRGPYTGSIGYIGFTGNMDLNIVIRTFTIKNGIAYVQAGAGIVADSEPEREYQESLRKAEALIKTLNNASA